MITLTLNEKSHINMNLKLIKEPFYSQYKIIISGEHIEIIDYEEPIFYNRSKKISENNNYLNNKKQTEISDSSYNRARKKMIRIINSNAGFYKKNEKHIILGAETLFGKEDGRIEESICEGCIKKTVKKHNGKYAKIMDWKKDKIIKFADILKT